MGKKLKNLGFLGEIFLTQTKDGRPEHTSDPTVEKESTRL